MTRKQTAIRIQNELQNQIGTLRNVVLVGHYKYSTDYHYEFILKDGKQSDKMIIINERENGEFDVWSMYNLGSTFASWLAMDIARTIHELNKKDAD